MKKSCFLMMTAMIIASGMGIQPAIGATVEAVKPAIAVPDTDRKSIADKIAIRELIDTFSIEADNKDGISQIDLFTKDAVVENYNNGKLTQTLKGNENIGKAFDDFLKTQDVVYHINGQQVIHLNGNKADGISYCFVTLIYTDKEGKTMKRQTGVRYVDDYVFQNGRWLIAHRKACFNWSEQVPYQGG